MSVGGGYSTTCMSVDGGYSVCGWRIWYYMSVGGGYSITCMSVGGGTVLRVCLLVEDTVLHVCLCA